MRHLIKQLRTELGLSQSAFAAATKAAQPTVSDWERGGRCPTKAQFRAILELAGSNPILSAKLTTAWIEA